MKDTLSRYVEAREEYKELVTSLREYIKNTTTDLGFGRICIHSLTLKDDMKAYLTFAEQSGVAHDAEIMLVQDGFQFVCSSKPVFPIETLITVVE